MIRIVIAMICCSVAVNLRMHVAHWRPAPGIVGSAGSVVGYPTRRRLAGGCNGGEDGTTLELAAVPVGGKVLPLGSMYAFSVKRSTITFRLSLSQWSALKACKFFADKSNVATTPRRARQ